MPKYAISKLERRGMHYRDIKTYIYICIYRYGTHLCINLFFLTNVLSGTRQQVIENV